MNTNKFKTILFTLTLTACNTTQNTQQTNSQDTDTIPIETTTDTITVVPDTITHETFISFAKEQCGLDISLDVNKWLPGVDAYSDVENSMTASFYTKDTTDLGAFLDNFLQQCIDASVAHAIGTDPKCQTVAEARERLIEKLVKNEKNPAEGYCYKGEIIYVHDCHKVIVTINFGSYANNLTTLYFNLKIE